MKKKQGSADKIRRILEYLIFFNVSFFVRPLSARTVFYLGRLIGSLAFLLAGKRKQIALTNLNIAFGDTKSFREKERIIKNSFIQMAISTVQCLWLAHDPEKRIHELIPEKPRGLESLQTCLERKRGVFFLTAHYSNWEAMGIYHGYLEISRLHSIVRHLDNPYLEKTAREFRTISGNGIFYREDSPLKIVRALKNNSSVAVMMDQNTARGGIFVDFFGKKAATARSVALLSYRTGAAILPLFSYPTAKGTYRIEYGPELILEKTGDKETDIRDWTRTCEQFIESVIRERPEPWMWGHRRWKTRPPEENGGKVY